MSKNNRFFVIFATEEGFMPEFFGGYTNWELAKESLLNIIKNRYKDDYNDWEKCNNNTWIWYGKRNYYIQRIIINDVLYERKK